MMREMVKQSYDLNLLKRELSEEGAECFRKVKYEFAQSGQKVPLAVYDMDDVLYLLLRRICKKIGVEFERACSCFNIRDNSNLSLDEQDKIYEEFTNPDNFSDIEFLEGAKDILRPMELGAEVVVKSNSLCQEIVERKIPQLLAHIDGLTAEMLDMPLIVQGSKQSKHYDPRTTIVVDDSPYNIMASPALLGIVPGWMPWSHSENAWEIMKGRRILVEDSLVEMNQCIYLLMAYLMGYVEL